MNHGQQKDYCVNNIQYQIERLFFEIKTNACT